MLEVLSLAYSATAGFLVHLPVVRKDEGDRDTLIAQGHDPDAVKRVQGVAEPKVTLPAKFADARKQKIVDDFLGLMLEEAVALTETPLDDEALKQQAADLAAKRHAFESEARQREAFAEAQQQTIQELDAQRVAAGDEAAKATAEAAKAAAELADVRAALAKEREQLEAVAAKRAAAGEDVDAEKGSKA